MELTGLPDLLADFTPIHCRTSTQATGGVRTSIGLRKVAVKSTPPQVMVKIVFVGVIFKRVDIVRPTSNNEGYVLSRLFARLGLSLDLPSKRKIGRLP